MGTSLLPEEVAATTVTACRKNVAHVVMVPNPVPGHGRPFLQAAKQLIDAGIAVTYVSTDGYIPQLLKSAEAQDVRSRGVRFAKLRDGTAHLSEKEFFKFMISPQGGKKLARLLEEVIADLEESSSESITKKTAAGAAAAVDYEEHSSSSLSDHHVVGNNKSAADRSTPPRPSCIMHDMFTTWTQQVADNLNIAKHLFFISPATVLAFVIELPRLRQQGIVPVTPQIRDTLVTDIPGIASLPAHEIPGDLHFGSPICDDMMKANSEYVNCSVILVNTFHALESWALDTLRKKFVGAQGVKTEAILEIGPLVLEAPVGDQGTKQKEPCIEWLDTQAPSSVIYISFGSLAALSAPEILTMAQGLEASNQPFLWVLRPPGVPFVTAWNSFGSSLPSLISDFLPPVVYGPKGCQTSPSNCSWAEGCLGTGFEECTQGRGMCVSGWVPQREILDHPATGGFLSHCGFNSVLETICAGVPFLAWPMIAEQGLNCRFLVDTAKVSIEIKKGKDGLTSEEVERKVRTLMQEEEGQTMKNKITEMRVAARKAVAEGGTSNQNFRAYVHLLQTGTLSHTTV